VDVWALGAVQYEMLHNRPCFSAESFAALEVRIYRAAHAPLRKDLSAGAKSFVRAALAIEPGARLTAEGLGSHPWILKR